MTSYFCNIFCGVFIYMYLSSYCFFLKHRCSYFHVFLYNCSKIITKSVFISAREKKIIKISSRAYSRINKRHLSRDYKFLQQQSSSFQKRVSNFMAKIGVHDSDAHIIEVMVQSILIQNDFFQMFTLKLKYCGTYIVFFSHTKFIIKTWAHLSRSH